MDQFSPFGSPVVSTPPPFKDRTTPLRVVGVLVMLFGGLFLLLALAMMFIPLPPETTKQAPRIFLALVYAVPGWILIAGGVGSFTARPWGRALMLVISWCWLVVGVLMMFGLVFALFELEKTQPETRNYFFRVAYLLASGTFTVAIPAVLVAFYSSYSVKATCHAALGGPAAVDSARQPVAIYVGTGLAALGVLASLYSAYDAKNALFGFGMRGMPATMLALVWAVVYALITYGLWRRHYLAWKGMFYLTLFGIASGIVGYFFGDMERLYRDMGYSEAEIQLMVDSPVTPYLGFIMLALSIPWLAFYWYLRRYYIPSTKGTEQSADAGAQDLSTAP